MRAVAIGLLACAWCLFAQTPLNERVMVVYNSKGRESLTVAKYYMEKRQIPKENLCKINADNQDSIWHGEDFAPQVKKPIRACLERIGKDKILYIVLSYLTPYSFVVNEHPVGVDQQIADIWDEYAPGGDNTGRQAGDQPYFGQAQSQGNAYEPYVPFAKYRDQPNVKKIYSVWRLDAATMDLAKGLVDKALIAEKNGLKGKGCFDTQYPVTDQIEDVGYAAGNWDIHRAAEFAKRAGFQVDEDQKEQEYGTAPAALRCDGAALYAGWYSLQHYNDAFTWEPGAIGFHLDSASATNIRKADNWAGGALLKGITVTSGAVTEPFLEGLVHPDQIFLYLFQGANVGDAVVRGTRWLKWLIVNIGDPLYRPFPQGAGPYASADYHESWLALAPLMVAGSSRVAGTFNLAARADKEVQVVVQSNKPGIVAVPSTLTITTGGTGVRFPITISKPKQQDNVVISAGLRGDMHSNTLTVFPILKDFTLSEPTVKSGGSVNATVTLNVVPNRSVSIEIGSSNPAALGVPATVIVPGGSFTASFRVAAQTVRTETTAEVSVTFDGAVKKASLKIAPADGSAKP